MMIIFESIATASYVLLLRYSGGVQFLVTLTCHRAPGDWMGALDEGAQCPYYYFTCAALSKRQYAVPIRWHAGHVS